MLTSEESLDLWHGSIKAMGDRDEVGRLLTALFDEDVTFRAPLYLTPRKGRDCVAVLLRRARAGPPPNLNFVEGRGGSAVNEFPEVCYSLNT